MSVYTIRDARTSEKELIAGLWLSLMMEHHTLDSRFRVADDAQKKYSRHLQEMIRTKNGRVLVAEVKETGELVGFMMGEIQPRPPIALPGIYGFISDLYVTQEWRRQGVARSLFVEMSRWFQSRKANAIELYAAEANPAAVAFWQTMGLKPFLRLHRLDI